MNKQKLVIIALAVTLFVVMLYIVFEKWVYERNQEKLNIYQDGYDQGLHDAVTTLFYNTKECNPTSLSLGNITKFIIDVSCLQTNSSRIPP